MFTNNFDPVAIQILSLEIRWYSLAYIAGILIGWILGKKLLISNHEIKENFELAEIFYEIHIIINYTLIILISLHIFAVIIHKLLFKENLLKRIL